MPAVLPMLPWPGGVKGQPFLAAETECVLPCVQLELWAGMLRTGHAPEKVQAEAAEQWPSVLALYKGGSFNIDSKPLHCPILVQEHHVTSASLSDAACRLGLVACSQAAKQ